MSAGLNCDERKCMSCVMRELHDACQDDCPSCCPTPPPADPEYWEYALFKRSNGHQAVAAVRFPEAVDARLLGLRPGRYVLRKRAVYAGPWADA